MLTPPSWYARTVPKTVEVGPTYLYDNKRWL